MPIYVRGKGSQELTRINKIIATDALSLYVFSDRDEALLIDSDDISVLADNTDAKIIYGYVTDENSVPTLVYRDLDFPRLLPLEQCDPEDIQKIVNSGLAANIWSIGDVTKDITLNGTVGAYEFNNESYHAILIGLDHNRDLETGGKHNAVFQFGQNEDGVNIAFIDSSYNSTGSTDAFRINTSNTNSGGWESSYMRNTICPEFLEAMPTDWQGVIGTTTKYTDNVGNATGSVKSNVTATEDKIFLLNEYEVNNSGSPNTYEANYTTAYSDIYSSNSDRIRYRHSEPSSTSIWWLRSPYRSSSYNFCLINVGGSSSSGRASNSYGFAPCFTVIADSR